METEKIIQDHFRDLSDQILARAKVIKLLITDVDGVLTDGGIIYDNEEMEYKKFNVKDGLAVKHLKQHKILVGAITGRASKVVENRCEELRFDFHYHGVKDKGKKLEEVLETMELQFEEVAYIGDDLIDLPVLAKVGLAVVPQDAVGYVKPQAHIVTQAAGGRGVFREVADLILFAKGHLPAVINSYLEK
ncbi:KdsC family phosphatase [Algoriphagus namhaensis]